MEVNNEVVAYLDKLKRQGHRRRKQEKTLDCTDLRNPFKERKQGDF
ncbi:hypothetical protein HSX44_00670 [Wolbachia endosymbiont of Onchocerca gibsoni]|nr:MULTISPECIES: hypothetical protein [unclassified Wolbachia]MDF0607424.1 hypothetical protein [Wolbachia endosymbiont of Onchocerca gibsoni]